jgi:hypothetical protein
MTTATEHVTAPDSLFPKPTSRVRVLREGWFYLPTFLIAKDDRHDKLSLFVKQVRGQRGVKAGHVRTLVKFDVLFFPDEDAMLEWITEHDAEELPEEADGNPRYVPEGWR